MTDPITTADVERLATRQDRLADIDRNLGGAGSVIADLDEKTATALRALSAERDTLRAELDAARARERALLDSNQAERSALVELNAVKRQLAEAQARERALREFYDTAVADGCEDDPSASDEESIGWIGEEPMQMTYGHIRRAALQETKP